MVSESSVVASIGAILLLLYVAYVGHLMFGHGTMQEGIFIRGKLMHVRVQLPARRKEDSVPVTIGTLNTVQEFLDAVYHQGALGAKLRSDLEFVSLSRYEPIEPLDPSSSLSSYNIHSNQILWIGGNLAKGKCDVWAGVERIHCESGWTWVVVSLFILSNLHDR